jgi:hypothetical protein
MIRDYQLVSPSLDGVLASGSLSYEGIVRPTEILRIFDGPASKGGSRRHSERERALLEDYFRDLHGIFLKKFAHFAVEDTDTVDDTLKLQAMLQEMVKIKKLIRQGSVDVGI